MCLERGRGERLDYHIVPTPDLRARHLKSVISFFSVTYGAGRQSKPGAPANLQFFKWVGVPLGEGLGNFTGGLQGESY